MTNAERVDLFLQLSSLAVLGRQSLGTEAVVYVFVIDSSVIYKHLYIYIYIYILFYNCTFLKLFRYVDFIYFRLYIK